MTKHAVRGYENCKFMCKSLIQLIAFCHSQPVPGSVAVGGDNKNCIMDKRTKFCRLLSYGTLCKKLCCCCQWLKIRKNRKILCRIVAVLVIVSLLKWAVQLELYFAREKVSYLNDPCELTETKLDQYRIAVIAYANVLEEFNQTYWVDFGTLLGVYRCNDVLPHDGDGDISRMSAGSTRQDRAMTNLMATRLKDSIGATLTRFTLSYKDITVDVFTWQREEDKLKYFYKVHGDQPQFPQDLVFPLKKAIFAGHTVAVPNKLTAMLQFRYPFSGPTAVVSYKWRCYFRSILTLGFKPPRCPKPIGNPSIISEALQNVTNSATETVS